MTREEAAAYIREQLFDRLDEICQEIKENATESFQLIAFHRGYSDTDLIAVVLADSASAADVMAESLMDKPPSMH